MTDSSTYTGLGKGVCNPKAFAEHRQSENILENMLSEKNTPTKV